MCREDSWRRKYAERIFLDISIMRMFLYTVTKEKKKKKKRYIYAGIVQSNMWEIFIFVVAQYAHHVFTRISGGTERIEVFVIGL